MSTQQSSTARWAEVSLWPAVRDDFLRWYADRQPEMPERDHASQPDPRWLLFAEFFRETGGTYVTPMERPEGSRRAAGARTPGPS